MMLGFDQATPALRQLCISGLIEAHNRGEVVTPPAGHEVYIVMHGGVQLQLLSTDGDQIILGHRQPWSLFDLNGAGAAERSRVVVAVMEDGTVICRFAWPAFVGAVSAAPEAVGPVLGTLTTQHEDER